MFVIPSVDYLVNFLQNWDGIQFFTQQDPTILDPKAPKPEWIQEKTAIAYEEIFALIEEHIQNPNRQPVEQRINLLRETYAFQKSVIQCEFGAFRVLKSQHINEFLFKEIFLFCYIDLPPTTSKQYLLHKYQFLFHYFYQIAISKFLRAAANEILLQKKFLKGIRIAQRYQLPLDPKQQLCVALHKKKLTIDQIVEKATLYEEHFTEIYPNAFMRPQEIEPSQVFQAVPMPMGLPPKTAYPQIQQKYQQRLQQFEIYRLYAKNILEAWKAPISSPERALYIGARYICISSLINILFTQYCQHFFNHYDNWKKYLSPQVTPQQVLEIKGKIFKSKRSFAPFSFGSFLNAFFFFTHYFDQYPLDNQWIEGYYKAFEFCNNPNNPNAPSH